jgi:4'-phosphopantetheinyl transferase
MSSNSEWAAGFFTASARDWTPPSVRDAACVLFAPFSRDSEVSGRCASVLSDAERQRAALFVTEDGKAHFQQRRAFRRYCGALALGGAPGCLSRVDFEATEKGRPFLPDLPQVWFSFSSCRFGFLGAWSSTHAIGVDLEDHTRSAEAVALAWRYYGPAEARIVERAGGPARQRVFFQLWSLKEAALKSIGEGLPEGLDAFEFELAPTLRLVSAPRNHGGPEQFDAHLLEGADQCAALVIRSLVGRPQSLLAERATSQSRAGGGLPSSSLDRA